jgi:Amt family ammonium transporter
MQSAFLIGIVGAVGANLFALWRSKSPLDDSLDVVACHGIGGALGVIMAGLLASKTINAAGVDGGMGQLMIQLKGVAVTAVFCFVVTFIILKVIDATMGLRPSVAEEEKGLDITQHNEPGYN